MDRTSLTLAVVAIAAALGLYLALSSPTPTSEEFTTPPPEAVSAEPPVPVAPEPTATEAQHIAQRPHEEPAAPAPPAAAVGRDEVMLPTQAGPLDELKHAFETEPRASVARDLELRVEAELKKPDIPAGMYRSVLCRSSVCREPELRWRPEHVNAYNIALVRMLHIFGMGLGVDPSPPDKDNELDIDMYMRRAPATDVPSGPG